MNNWKDAARSLRRNPGFAVSAVGILALGIGVSTAMFGLANTVLRRPLPVRNQDRLAVVHGHGLGNIEHVPVSFTRYKAIRDASRAFSEVAGFGYGGTWPHLVDDGDRRLTLVGALVTGNFFHTLGARPVLGRLLEPADDVFGAQPVLVLSDAAWRRDFHADRGVIGHHLTLHDRKIQYTIVGVAPSGLSFPGGAEYWAPIVPFTTPAANSPGIAFLDVVGRLAPGATMEQSRGEFQGFLRHDGFDDRPRAMPGASATVESFSNAVFGNAKPILTAMAAAVALLFLITCINVGNLMLLRAASRRREIAVRRAIGARYADVARQLLVESVLISATAGAIGLALAAALWRMIGVVAPSTLPRLDDVAGSGAPVFLAVTVTCAATIIFGVAPALWAAREDPSSVLQSASRSGTESSSHAAFKRGLVVCQVALAIVVLAAAGVVTRSLARLQRLDLGFNPDRLTIVEVTWPQGGLANLPTTRAAMDGALERVQHLPGVIAATPLLVSPFSGLGGWSAEYNARATSADTTKRTWLNVEAVGPDYFKTFEIPVRRGRAFADADRDGAERVVIISEALARHFWPREEAVGQEIGGPFIGKKNEFARVVGVVPDTRYRDLRAPMPTIYFPHRQFVAAQSFIGIRTAGNAADIIPVARKAIAGVDPDVVMWRARTMENLLADPMAEPRLSAALLGGFGIGALLLAAFGLYAVTATAVRSRTRELGIRVALGASPTTLYRMVLRQASSVVLIGVVVGLVGAVAAARFVQAMVFDVSPTDPASLASVTLILVGVALVAAFVPARRAARVDPVGALRAE